MSEGEIIGLVGRLESELSSGAHAGAIEVLEELARAPFSVPLLAKTRVGVRAAKLRDHEHAGVASAARECVRIWKKLAEESGATAKSSGKSSESATSASANSTVPEATNTSSASVVAAVSAPPTVQTKPSPPQALPPLPPARARVREGLGKVLEDVVVAYLASPEGKEQISSGSLPSKASDNVGSEARLVSGAIEEALFAALGGVNDAAPSPAYADQFKSLFFNLRRNVPLSINVFWGFVSPTIVATLTAEELATEEAKKQVEAAKSAGIESVMLDWKQKNRNAVLTAAGLSTALTGAPCKKCKSKNTDFTQRQMRSGDEPMSLCVPHTIAGPVTLSRLSHTSPSHS